MDDLGLWPDVDHVNGEDDDSLIGVVIGAAHIVAIGVLYCLCRRYCCGRKSSQPVQGAEAEVEHLQPRKRLITSYLLLFGCGLIGGHHFYLDRLVHGLLCLWTGNLMGVGWFLDAVLMPYYVHSFNSRRCAPTAPYDTSRRRLLCRLPLALVGAVTFLLVLVVRLPYALHVTGILDIDRLAAQTEVNPYDTLGIPRTATLAEAKSAYRKESLRWHPDRNHGCGKRCEGKMSEITKAFELIKRRRAPVTEARSWESWAQDLGNDWWHVLEAFSAGTESSETKGKSSAKTDL
mmetsp:Transcript_99551/g.257254  ORF Transcript_99551/g.257254 Transcript_99551/m.257254 type:complete len:290 (+) Transcript_99551:80-949(+)